MKICLLIPILMLTMVSCQTKSKPVAPKTDLEMVQGEWALAGFKTDPTATGKLTLNADKTFTGKMGSAKSKPGSKEPYSTDLAGKFALTRESVGGEKVLFVNLKITTMDGKPAPTDCGMRLSYDPKGNVLTDLLMVFFARPNEVNRVKEKLESAKRSRG